MLTNSLSYLVTGYPYFSLLYLIIFWKRIKTDENILNTSNFICVILSLPSIYIILEILSAWYSGNMYEQYSFAKRAYGSWELFISVAFSVILIKQIFWFKKIRVNKTATIVISVFTLFIAYFDEIIGFALSYIKTDFSPSMWLSYEPWYVKYFFTPLKQTIAYGSVVFIFTLIQKKLVNNI
ncbi:MAG: hypothetical protein U0U67_07200 [Chitinophagales bacterium]